MIARSRAYRRHQREDLALAALLLGLVMVALVFGALAWTAVATTVALGYGFLSVLATVAVSLVCMEVLAS